MGSSNTRARACVCAELTCRAEFPSHVVSTRLLAARIGSYISYGHLGDNSLVKAPTSVNAMAMRIIERGQSARDDPRAHHLQETRWLLQQTDRVVLRILSPKSAGSRRRAKGIPSRTEATELLD